jgi:hypothetical protein
MKYPLNSKGHTVQNLRLGSKSGVSCSNITMNIGREIPEEVASRTDHQNEFPSEMWKKLGEAG